MAESDVDIIEVSPAQVAGLEKDIAGPSATDPLTKRPAGTAPGNLTEALNHLDASQKDAAARFLHGETGQPGKNDSNGTNPPSVQEATGQQRSIQTDPHLAAALDRLASSQRRAINVLLNGTRPNTQPEPTPEEPTPSKE